MALLRITRKFNLARIGRQYESIEIAAEGAKIEQLIIEIENAFKTYLAAITAGIVR